VQHAQQGQGYTTLLDATRFRSVTAAVAAFGVAASIVFVGGPASAASVELVVNVSTSQSVYAADATATYTVRVDNRGTQNTSVPSTVTLTAPNTQGGNAPWEQSVTCAAFAGAVCPSAFTRSADTISADIPSVPATGYLVFTVSAPGVPSNRLRGAIAITATIAPQSGDVDVAQATDESSITILIGNPDARYSGTATGPSFADALSDITYDVVVSNDGSRNSLRPVLSLAAGEGSGTATATPVRLFGFTGVECVAETVLGLCANVRALSPFGGLLSPQPNPITLSGTTVQVGVIDMPAGSAVTLRLTVNPGRPSCNDALLDATRVLTLTNTVRNFLSSSGLVEPPAQNPDNFSTVLTNLPAPPCVVGDLAVLSLSQLSAQAAAGVDVGGTFAFTATYTNLSGLLAIGAQTAFTAVWPVGPGAVMDASATCVASGTAVCPTSHSATGATVRGFGAQLPVGTDLTIT
jgi:hypothetical protein